MSKQKHKDKISYSKELSKGIWRLKICKKINSKQLRMNSGKKDWSYLSIMKSVRNLEKTLKCLNINLPE